MSMNPFIIALMISVINSILAIPYSWCIESMLKGVVYNKYYSFFKLKETTKEEGIAGIFWAGFTVKFTVCVVFISEIAIMKEFIHTICNEYYGLLMLYLIASLIIAILNNIMTMEKRFSKFSRLINTKKELEIELLEIRRTLIQCRYKLDDVQFLKIDKPLKEILEKISKCVDTHGYDAEFIEGHGLKFNEVITDENKESTHDIDKKHNKNEYDYAKNNIKELRKGILNLKNMMIDL